MELIRANGTDAFDELEVRITVAELQSIERAMRQYDEAVHKADRETFNGDQEVLAGLWEIFDELELPREQPWP